MAHFTTTYFRERYGLDVYLDRVTRPKDGLMGAGACPLFATYRVVIMKGRSQAIVGTVFTVPAAVTAWKYKRIDVKDGKTKVAELSKLDFRSRGEAVDALLQRAGVTPIVNAWS